MDQLSLVFSIMSFVVGLYAVLERAQAFSIFGNKLTGWRVSKLQTQLAKMRRMVADSNYLISSLAVKLGSLILLGTLAVVELVSNGGEVSLVFYLLCLLLGGFMGAVLTTNDLVRDSGKQIAKLEDKVKELQEKRDKDE